MGEHDTIEQAREHAKRLTKQLTPGERNYYKMGYLVREKKATDSTRKAPARLHRALDAVMDARPVRAKDLNTTPPRDALASQAKARAWLERLQDQMQPAYAAEESARERYKNASRDQRDKYDLEKKWSAASAKVAQLEKEWDQAHAAIKRAIPGFEC
jgi:hypothetical protein